VVSGEEDSVLRIWDIDIDCLLANPEERVNSPLGRREAERSGPHKLRDKVFISYSSHDREWLEHLQIMLTPLVRNGSISPWDDTKIQAGAQWKEEIAEALASARVAVLLVSKHFLASKFIVEEELPPLLAAAKREGVTILWIYVSACLYDETPVHAYKAAHDISRTLEEMNPAECNRAIAAICRRIAEAAGGL
jgi:hypothetical protein